MPAWNIQVSDALDEAVNKAVKTGRFTTKAELIRTAVREKLDSMGITNSR